MNERERIELLMRCYDLTPSQFADKTGIQRASVSHIISGRNKPSLEVMLKIYEAFPGVDMKWLMMGEGEVPVRKEVQQEQQPIVDALFPVGDAVSRQAVTRTENSLFAAVEPVQSVADEAKPRRTVVPAQREKGADSRPKRSQAVRAAQMMSLQAEKKIKEVRIYYSDGTYETLIPETGR